MSEASHQQRVAVVELQAVHEEVAASHLWALEAAGVTATAYVNRRALSHGEVLETYGGCAGRVHYRDLGTPADLDALVEELRAGADALVLNTFSGASAELVRRTGLPAVGVVHNPDVVLATRACVELLQSGQVQPAVLAPHVATYMMSRAPALLARTVVLGFWMADSPQLQEAARARLAPAGGRRRVAVPGAVYRENRDFDGLLEIVPTILDQLGPDAVELQVVGGGPDRAWLEEEADRRGLGSVLTFAPLDPASRRVLSDDYYPTLAAADLLLPLLPDDREDYRVSKITSVVPTSLGYGVPLVLDRWTSNVYDLPAFTYPVGEAVAGLLRAVRAPAEEVAAVRERLVRRREREQERGLEGLRLALASLGAAPGVRRRAAAFEATDTGTTTETENGAGVAATLSTLDRDDAAAFLTFVEAARSRSYAQRMQDLWALWESGFALGATFAEFGALNGRDYSNTYVLERLGWTGVVAEPHPDYATVLRENRRCRVSHECVLDRSGQTVEFHAVQGRPALSTIAGYGASDERSHFREQFVTHQVTTTTLADLLDGAGLTGVLDFLSIDTEGSEVDILRAHDFEAHPIRLISVEHNEHQRDALHELLTERGYRRKWPELSGHDDWYALEGCYPDWSAADVDPLLAALARVPGYAGNDQELTNLLIGLRASTPGASRAPSLPALAVPGAITSLEADDLLKQRHRFAVGLARNLAPEDAEAPSARGLMRVFARAADALDVDLAVVLGTPAGPAGRAAQRLTSIRPSVRVVPLDVGVPLPGAPRPDDDVPGVGRERSVVVLSPVVATESVLGGATRLLAGALAVLVAPWGPDDRPAWQRQGEADLVARLAAHGLVPVAGTGLAPDATGILLLRDDVLGRGGIPRLVARALVG